MEVRADKLANRASSVLYVVVAARLTLGASETLVVGGLWLLMSLIVDGASPFLAPFINNHITTKRSRQRDHNHQRSH